MSATTTQPAPRIYTAADFVADQTRHLDWPGLRQWAEDEYGLTQQETWTMTRPVLLATLAAAEQHRAQDDHWGRWLADAAD
jgi:hypothetical protein